MAGQVSVNNHGGSKATTPGPMIRVQCANCGFVTEVPEAAYNDKSAACWTCKSQAMDKVAINYARPDMAHTRATTHQPEVVKNGKRSKVK